MPSLQRFRVGQRVRVMDPWRGRVVCIVGTLVDTDEMKWKWQVRAIDDRKLYFIDRDRLVADDDNRLKRWAA